jgi:glucosylglycerate synthase
VEQKLQAKLSEIKEADILVGLPSYNDVRTIGHVVRTITAGLLKHFPAARAVLVNSDGGSTDGTREEALRAQAENVKVISTSHPEYPVHKIVTPYHGIPGKGTAFRVLFEAAAALHVKACAIVDSGLRSITPEWVELLLKPIYEGGFDYVAPLYARDKFDGTITNSIVYPLTRALYGKRVRQPIASDFGFSGKLAEFYLTKGIWDSDVIQFGIDMWMTTVAITAGYKVCQSHLGPRIHETKGPGSDLGSLFTQVVSSVYDLMETYEDFWKNVNESQLIPTFGLQREAGLESVPVNVGRMIRSFRLGVKELMEIWRRVLFPETALWLESVGRLADESFSFPQDLWGHVVYDFAVGYHKGSFHREHLLKSMIPLYLGRVASFIMENQGSPADESEENIESLCRVFEGMKPYLIDRWTS